MKLEEKRKELSLGFLETYTMRQELANDGGEDGERNWNTPGKTVRPDAYSREALAQGQIRVLSGTERLTYVVLLRRWEDDSFLVAPFSNFSYPATDEELLLKADGGLFMRVLQIWNIRSLQDETLRKSWLVGDMEEQDRQDAWSLLEWCWGGQEVSDDVLSRTGVPIYREEDPRLRYKQSELQNFAEVDARDAAYVDE